MGRRTKLNKDVCDKICVELREGCSLEGAAEAAGISSSAFFNWMKRGSKSKSGIYVEFVEAIKKADAEGQTSLIKEVRTAARKGQWQAAAWLLERKWPNLWGKQEKRLIEHSGELKTVSIEKRVTELKEFLKEEVGDDRKKQEEIIGTVLKYAKTKNAN